METRLPSANGVSIQKGSVKTSVSWPANGPNWSDLPLGVRIRARQAMEHLAGYLDRSIKEANRDRNSSHSGS